MKNINEELKIKIHNIDDDSKEKMIELLEIFRENLVLGNMGTTEKFGNDSYKRGSIEAIEKLRMSLKFKEVIL